MAKCVFRAGKMASQQLDVMLTNAKMYDATPEEIEVEDGALVKLGALETDNTYKQTLNEFDVYKATYAVDAEEMCIVDYAGISAGEINENQYRMGIKLYGLKAPKGEIVRVRRLGLHDKFWLGEANFTAAPTLGQYAQVGANGKHAPLAALSTEKYAVQIIYAEDLTVGMKSEGKIYLCEVVKL